MSELVLTLYTKDYYALGLVRTLPYLRIAEHNGLLWVRGITGDKTPDLRVQQLPAIQTYTIDENDSVFARGAQTPTQNIRHLTWVPIEKYIPVEAPTSALPATVIAKLSVKLVPATQEHAGAALLTSFEHWMAYAETAPAVRLNALRFAVSEAGEALIMGSPLPPLPGSSYWRLGQTLLPAGWQLDISITATLLEKRLALPPHALLLISPDNRWHILPAHAFAQATRSAVRLTRNNLEG